MRNIDSDIERFLISNDHCRLCTKGKDGFPHCVPVGYAYGKGQFYFAANSKSVKVRNLRADRRCCIIVDVYQNRIGRGVMLQGVTTLFEGQEFRSSKNTVESLTGWHLDKWRVGKRGRDRVDIIIEFKPSKVVRIGDLS